MKKSVFKPGDYVVHETFPKSMAVVVDVQGRGIGINWLNVLDRGDNYRQLHPNFDYEAAPQYLRHWQEDMPNDD